VKSGEDKETKKVDNRKKRKKSQEQDIPVEIVNLDINDGNEVVYDASQKSDQGKQVASHSPNNEIIRE